MERVDIYDQDGNRTGKVIARGEALQEGEYLLTVGIWIVDRDDRIFLTKRSMEKSFAPGKWENTSGHVQAGEDCVHAILRELWEETGIEAGEGQLTLLGSACSAPYLGRNYGVHLNVALEGVKFQEGETCEAKWVDFPEFVRMAKAGELSPSLLSHLPGYRENFLKFIGQPDSALL